MTTSQWDPLQEALEAPELINLSKRRAMKNIIKSYTGWFDPISEMIQNALDAVEPMREVKKQNYTPTIWITIDLKKNTITVKDNGIGIKEDQIKYFLRPEISYKDTKKSRGNKGVGASYLAYGFNNLDFETKSKGFSFHGIIKGGREWVEDETNTKPRPLVKRLAISSELKHVDSGSVFRLEFSGDYIRPKNLDWLGVDDAERWEQILRISTPLGGIYLDQKIPHINCTITVVNKSGAESQKSTSECEFLYPHKIFQNVEKLGEIVSAQTKLVKSGQDPVLSLPGKFKKLTGIYETWDAESILTRSADLNPQLSEDQKDLMRKYKPIIYGFFSYSVRGFDSFNKTRLKVRPGIAIIRGGLQLATRNMPQGPLITIPLTKTIGYQKTSFVIVHFKDAEPDLGRKGFQPEITELAEVLSVSVVNYLKRWNSLLQRDTGVPIDIQAGRTLHDWIKVQEEHQEKHPLTIANEHFFLPMKKISILSEPLSEQDVVVLLNQLIAGGVIRGIRILATTQYQQYDSACRVVIDPPLDNHAYNEKTNPLGIKIEGKDPVESKPLILEYKYSMDALIDEFDKEEKDEKNVNLVVCWEMGEKWHERYSIASLLLKNNVRHRPFHGVTHVVRPLNTDNILFYVVCLHELVEYLNDPVKSQKTQEERYLQQ